MRPSPALLIAADACPVLARGCILRPPGEGKCREKKNDYPSGGSDLVLSGIVGRRQISSGCKWLSLSSSKL